MNDIYKMVTHISRVREALTGIVEIVNPFLASRNGKDSPNKEALMAFDLLERFCYNSKGILLILPEFISSHNMAVPLSQIFRAITYDAVVSFWLLGEENVLAERMLILNGDYVKKNGSKLSQFIDADRLQQSFKGWQFVAPDNFRTAVDGRLELVKYTRTTFDMICQKVEEQHQHDYIKTLPRAYTVLSQQAHISLFSKLITYGRVDSNYHLFDAICRALLPTCLLLLSKIEGSEKEYAELNNLTTRLYAGSERLTK